MAPPITMLFSAADGNTSNWFIMHNSFHPRTPCKFWVSFWEGYHRLVGRESMWHEFVEPRLHWRWWQTYRESCSAAWTSVRIPSYYLLQLVLVKTFSKPYFPVTSATPYCADMRDSSDSPFQHCLSHHGQMVSLLHWQLLSGHHTIWPLLWSQLIAVYVYKPEHRFP